MPTYRAYLMTADDRVASFRPLDADSDAEALKAARQFVDGCDVEVWQLDRQIGRLEHGIADFSFRAGEGFEDEPPVPAAERAKSQV
jgi:hypothetical protein